MSRKITPTRWLLRQNRLMYICHTDMTALKKYKLTHIIPIGTNFEVNLAHLRTTMKLLLLVLLLLVAIPAFTQQDSVKITTPGDTVVVTRDLDRTPTETICPPAKARFDPCP